jgi:hypothetical protein
VPSRKTESLERRLKRKLVTRAVALIVLLVLYIALSNGLQSLLQLGGMVLFFFGQTAKDQDRRRARFFTLGAFGVWLLYFVVSYALGTLLAPQAWSKQTQSSAGPTLASSGANSWFMAGSGRLPPEIALVLLPLGFAAFGFLLLAIPIVMSNLFGTMRRLQREQALYRAAIEGMTPAFLHKMREMVDTRIEDVGFHLKYAEALFAQGNHRQAAVEARLLLVQDPYHFNGNLLLANAYYALRLYGDCLKVCEDYLAVTGYCFEFAELKQQCLQRLPTT